MAGEIGLRLLGELQTTRLGELCILLNNDLNPQTFLRIPAIDRILSIIWQPPPPQAAVQQRVPPAARGRPVIEITSVNTACGKTHILYFTAVLSTLPPLHGRVPLGGRSAAVVVFDADGRFDVCRLYAIARQHIHRCHQEAESAISEADADAVATSALQHVHLYRPRSSSSLVEMLKGLPDYLLQPGGHNSAQRCLDAVLVDGLSAFYWQDRLAGQELGDSVYQETYEAIVQRLRQASARFGALIVVTNWGLQPSESTRPSFSGVGVPPAPVSGGAAELPVFRSHLPAVWSNFVDVKLVVMRDATVPFRRGIPIAEALQERGAHEGAREGAASHSSFTGWVDVRNLSVNLQESLDGRDRMFRFSISQDGITFAS